MLAQNRSLTRLAVAAPPSREGKGNPGPRNSSVGLSTVSICSSLKKYSEAVPKLLVRSKPMLCAETLNNLRMKEFYRKQDFEKYEALKHQLDHSIAAIMQKKQKADPHQYLGPELVQKHRENLQARIVYKKKARKVQADHSEAPSSTARKGKAGRKGPA